MSVSIAESIEFENQFEFENDERREFGCEFSENPEDVERELAERMGDYQ